MSRKFTIAAAALGALATGALAGSSTPCFSEIFVNPPGTDGGQEGLELAGPASSALTGHYIVIVEGDGTGAGLVDVVLDLGALSFGTNGLLLWRDSSSTISPAPDPATAIHVADFSPDIENGSNTYILATGTPVTVGTDLDTDNDGAFEAAFPMTVLDAVSLVENDGVANFAYADDAGFPAAVLGPFSGPVPAAHTPDAAYRVFDVDGNPWAWCEGDVTGTNPGGPYSFDLVGEFSGFDAFGIAAQDVDLGTLNTRKTFRGTPASLIASVGGAQSFELRAGSAHAGKQYFVLGSVSGTSPGLPFNPNALLPLNYDFYFQFTLSFPNTLISNSFAALDGNGNGTATFNLPAVVIPVAATVNHAYLVLSPFSVPVAASNAVPVILNP